MDNAYANYLKEVLLPFSKASAQRTEEDINKILGITSNVEFFSKITEEKKSCNSVNNGITEEKGDFSPGKYSYFRESLTITFAEKIKGYQDRYGGCEESFYILNSLLEQNDFFAYNYFLLKIIFLMIIIWDKKKDLLEKTL